MGSVSHSRLAQALTWLRPRQFSTSHKAYTRPGAGHLSSFQPEEVGFTHRQPRGQARPAGARRPPYSGARGCTQTCDSALSDDPVGPGPEAAQYRRSGGEGTGVVSPLLPRELRPVVRGQMLSRAAVPQDGGRVALLLLEETLCARTPALYPRLALGGAALPG